MYLSNPMFSSLDNNGIFQNSKLFAANSGIFSSAEKPQTALQNISEQIVSKQAGTERLEDLSKAAQIRKDTYVKADEATSLEEAPTELLELFLHNTKMYLTMSEGYEQELLDFKEQLQEWDKTIQEYQDMLDGAPIPELTDRKVSRTLERKGAKPWKRKRRKKGHLRLDTTRHSKPARYGW